MNNFFGCNLLVLALEMIFYSFQLRDIAAYFKDELKGDIVVPEIDEDQNQSDMILTIFSLVESCHLTNKITQGTKNKLKLNFHQEMRIWMLTITEAVTESVLNGILTCVLCFEVPEETREKLVHNFANKLADLSTLSSAVNGGTPAVPDVGNKYVAVRLRV